MLMYHRILVHLHVESKSVCHFTQSYKRFVYYPMYNLMCLSTSAASSKINIILLSRQHNIHTVLHVVYIIYIHNVIHLGHFHL